MKIVIVDDELTALHNFLSDVIGRTDIDYKFFKDDPEAVCDYVSKNPVDGAFLDVSMPSVNGVELAEKLLDIRPALKIAFVTGLDISFYDLPERVKDSVAGFLYKPYEAGDLRRILGMMGGRGHRLTARMFGAFDCFIDDMPVRFSSRKSKELFALLLTYNGKTLTMGDAISQLWPDMETDKSKPLYRDAVWRLRKTLKDIDFNCVNFERAQLVLDKSNISCDFWDCEEGKYKPDGEFLKSYEWSTDYFPD